MMLRRLLFTALLCCWATACGKIEPGGGKLNDACLRSSDCLDPFVCTNGRCALESSSRVCQPDQTRCNGDALEICTSTGEGYELKEECTRGCVGGACRPEVCTAGAQRCNNNTIEECLPNGIGWAIRNTCPTSCDVDPEDETKAVCTAPICTAFETQCSQNNSEVLQTCNSNGTAFVDSPCSTDPSVPAACFNGRCQPIVCTTTRNSTGTITGREQRCRGVVAEQCNDGGTAWEAREVCSYGCEYDEPTGQATCPASICASFSTRCAADGVTLQTCNATGTKYTDTTCTAPGGGEARCVNGGCLPKVCSVLRNEAGGITARDQVCAGNIRQQCNNTETAFENFEYCQYGCQPDGQGTKCAQPACQVGEQRCNGLALEMCTPDRSGFAFVQYCASGCAPANTSPATATCALPACSPLARRCLRDAQNVSHVEVCRADGTQFDVVETCPQNCIGGTCVVTDSQCTPGDLRCTGQETQLCVRLSNGATEWRFQERCFGTCSSGVCSSRAACGCEGGATATATCGATGAAKSPIVVKAMLPSTPNLLIPCATSTEASRILVYTDVITSASGVVVPDGTMITFANDSPPSSPDNLVVSADADPALPGIQRPTRNGRASAIVKAPLCTGTRTVTVTASAGGNCGGTTTVSFAPTSGGNRKVYIAEDFTSDRFNDRSVTTAQWDTTRGAAVANPSYELGTGSDLDLTVDFGTFDLQASGYSTAWNVTAISSNDVTLDTSTPLTLIAGDEVLLTTIWGPSASTGTGNYEFKRVAAVGANSVTFTDGVRNAYGNGTNADLTGHRVVLQRVPQFNNLTVGVGATLTSSGVSTLGCTSNCTPGGGTGIMAFRARGIVSIRGTVTMDGAGYPGGLSSYPSLSPLASLNRLFLGRNGTQAGGGVIYIAAGTLSFAADPYQDPPDFVTDGSVRANAGSPDGSAGTIWLLGGQMRLGATTRIFASTGGSGHVRLDYGSLDNTFNPAASSGTQFTGQGGALIAQSRPMLELAESSSSLLTAIDFIGAIGGSDSTRVSFTLANPAIPGVSVAVSGDGGATWADASAGAVVLDSSGNLNNPQQGKSFKFRAALSTVSDAPLLLNNVAFSVTVQ